MQYIAAMRRICLLLILALFAISCSDSGDDDLDSAAEPERDVSPDLGTLDDLDLSVVVTDLAEGFGMLGAAQEQAIAGVAEGGGSCAQHQGQRARPRPSQIEVEIVSIVDDCLEFSYEVADFRSFVADIRALREGPGVLAASPLLLDYRFDEVESQRSLAAIDAEPVLAQAEAPTGDGITIAIIDSGIDAALAELEGVEIIRVPDTGIGDYTATGHGTVSASLIAGPIAGASRGIAPDATLLDVPADLCGPDVCGCDPCASMTPAEAIRWSVDNGADIISMSFGYQPTPKPAWWQLLLDENELSAALATIEVALAYADFSGVAMVAAAGNCATGPNARCAVEDQFEIPAGHGSVVGVGAVTVDEDGDAARAPYSTRQPYVELVAPGSVVIVNDDGERFEKSGTSFATPFVSAALAIVLGDDGPLAQRPDGVEEARELLALTATDLAPSGRDAASGFGQLQLDAFLNEARTYASENPLEPPVLPEPDTGT